MTLPDIILLSIALAMDCFAVSIASGVIAGRRCWGLILWIAALFGFFQALMPLIGWGGVTSFASFIGTYGYWVAFALLLFLGVRMIVEGLRPADERHFDPRHLATQVLLAIATSIDALAVGVSLGATGYPSLASMTFPVFIIGSGSFLFSIAGHLLGIRFGKTLRSRLRPEPLGGIILIIIGVKILVASLLDI